jgi:hypothetical protein
VKHVQLFILSLLCFHRRLFSRNLFRLHCRQRRLMYKVRKNAGVCLF